VQRLGRGVFWARSAITFELATQESGGFCTKRLVVSIANGIKLLTSL